MQQTTLNQAQVRLTDLLVRQHVPRGAFGFKHKGGDLVVVCVIDGAIREYIAFGRGDTALMMTAQQIAVDMGR